MQKHSCGKCKYKWIPRVKKPKNCPRCKQALSYDNKLPTGTRTQSNGSV